MGNMKASTPDFPEELFDIFGLSGPWRLSAEWGRSGRLLPEDVFWQRVDNLPELIHRALHLSPQRPQQLPVLGGSAS